MLEGGNLLTLLQHATRVNPQRFPLKAKAKSLLADGDRVCGGAAAGGELGHGRVKTGDEAGTSATPGGAGVRAETRRPG